MEFKPTDLLCKAAGFHMNLLGLASVIHFVILFLERTCRIRSNRQYHPLDDKRYLIIAAIWLYVFLWALAPLLGWGSYLSQVVLVYHCPVRMPQMSLFHQLYFYGLIFFVFGLSVSAIVVMFVLTKIRMKNNLKALRAAGAHLELVNARSLQIRRFDQMTMLMALIFFSAWTPFACIAFYHLITGRKLMKAVILGTQLTAKSCVLFNPFIYAYYYMNIGPTIFLKFSARRSGPPNGPPNSADGLNRGRVYTVTTKM